MLPRRPRRSYATSLPTCPVVQTSGRVARRRGVEPGAQLGGRCARRRPWSSSRRRVSSRNRRRRTCSATAWWPCSVTRISFSCYAVRRRWLPRLSRSCCAATARYGSPAAPRSMTHRSTVCRSGQAIARSATSVRPTATRNVSPTLAAWTSPEAQQPAVLRWQHPLRPGGAACSARGAARVPCAAGHLPRSAPRSRSRAAGQPHATGISQSADLDGLTNATLERDCTGVCPPGAAP
jgi:hypothetical protein